MCLLMYKKQTVLFCSPQNFSASFILNEKKRKYNQNNGIETEKNKEDFCRMIADFPKKIRIFYQYDKFS